MDNGTSSPGYVLVAHAGDDEPMSPGHIITMTVGQVDDGPIYCTPNIDWLADATIHAVNNVLVAQRLPPVRLADGGSVIVHPSPLRFRTIMKLSGAAGASAVHGALQDGTLAGLVDRYVCRELHSARLSRFAVVDLVSTGVCDEVPAEQCSSSRAVVRGQMH